MQQKVYKLTNPQKSIWFTQEFFKGTSIENITGTVIMPNKVDFKILEKAINIYVAKNDSFRLKFFIENKIVKQYVEPYSEFKTQIIDVLSDAELKKVSEEISHTPFDVIDSLLFDFKLIRFPDAHGGFILNAHHLISDAWNSGICASEVIRIYTSLIKDEDLTNLFYPSYIEYINSEQEYMQGERFSKDKIFWNNIFKYVPEIATIPSTKPLNNTMQLGTASRKHFNIPKNLIEKVNGICKTYKFSIFNFFMAVYAIYVGRISNLDEFTLGTPILNRSNVKEKHTSGMFINTVPVKISLNNNMKFTDFASSISSDLFNIFKHQKYPYLSLLEDLRQKDSSIPNLYNILISYQNIRSDAQNLENPFEVTWIPNGYVADDIDIHIYDLNDTGNIDIAYDYKNEKYSEEDIKNIHNRILNIVNSILGNAEISIDDIEIVTDEEKNTLLKDFNNTKVKYDETKTLSTLIEEQALRTPNRVALVFENKEMTYKELNEKSNSLANYLRNQGIQPNDIVRHYV